MYILKNAWVSITRNKSRNVLMGIIILVIACSCCITLSIRSSASKLVDSYVDKYDIEATISMNRENLLENFKPGSSKQEENIQRFNEIESLTEEEIITYGTSEYVKEFYYTYNLSLDSSTLEKATQEIESESSFNSFNSGRGGMPDGMMRNERMSTGDFTVLGYSSFESMSDFIDGKYTIVDGEVSDDFTGNGCVINQELALLNDVSVGDTITLINPNNEDLTYDFVVTGIFTEQEEDSQDSLMSMFSSSVNTIITNTTILQTIVEADEELQVTLTPTFILNSENVIEEFSNEVTEKGLSEFYQVTTNLETIELGTESIKNVSTFATTFLVLTLIIGGVVLFVLNMINVRERKYEIGVLRTIGMKKQLVMLQFMTELLIVAFAALLLGAGLGSICSVPVANQLLKNEIESASNQQMEVGNNFGGKGGPAGKDFGDRFKPSGVMQLDKVTSIDAVVDFKVVVQLLGIGIVLTLISSISATVAISRFSPITILKERS